MPSTDIAKTLRRLLEQVERLQSRAYARRAESRFDTIEGRLNDAVEALRDVQRLWGAS